MNKWPINTNRAEPLDNTITRLRCLTGLRSESSQAGRIRFRFECGMEIFIKQGVSNGRIKNNN